MFKYKLRKLKNNFAFKIIIFSIFILYFKIQKEYIRISKKVSMSRKV